MIIIKNCFFLAILAIVQSSMLSDNMKLENPLMKELVKGDPAESSSLPDMKIYINDVVEEDPKGQLVIEPLPDEYFEKDSIILNKGGAFDLVDPIKDYYDYYGNNLNENDFLNTKGNTNDYKEIPFMETVNYDYNFDYIDDILKLDDASEDKTRINSDKFLNYVFPVDETDALKEDKEYYIIPSEIEFDKIDYKQNGILPDLTGFEIDLKSYAIVDKIDNPPTNTEGDFTSNDVDGKDQYETITHDLQKSQYDPRKKEEVEEAINAVLDDLEYEYEVLLLAKRHARTIGFLIITTTAFLLSFIIITAVILCRRTKKNAPMITKSSYEVLTNEEA